MVRLAGRSGHRPAKPALKKPLIHSAASRCLFGQAAGHLGMPDPCGRGISNQSIRLKKVDDNVAWSVTLICMKELLRTHFTYLERLVSIALLIGMGVVIILAAWSFLRFTYFVALEPNIDISYGIFQSLFDRLLAAIIALELARSIILLIEGRRGFVQVRIILVIGLLAVVRKLILIDLEAVDGTLLFALAAAVLALAASLALVIYFDPAPTGDD